MFRYMKWVIRKMSLSMQVMLHTLYDVWKENNKNEIQTFISKVDIVVLMK